ncbi:MAG: hypothetical protein QOK31_403 [Solirubrobacteraceae bacterium]|nr:hypothetical protein [Solirubrobacteraceae bacterium]
MTLPPGVSPPFDVFLNGVPQEAGRDYEFRDGALVFRGGLVQEKKLGAKAWFLGFWGIGTYGRNDTVDIRYEQNGRPAVAHALPLQAG